MADITDIRSKAKRHICHKYPLLKSDDITTPYEVRQIIYKQEMIGLYDVAYWHRLLKAIYQEPPEIESELYDKDNLMNCIAKATFRKSEETSEWIILNTTPEVATKLQSGMIVPQPLNWKYLIKLPSGGTIIIGTKDKTSLLYVAHVVGGSVSDADQQHAEIYISLLLDEAKKNENQINPINEFEQAEGVRLYHLFNVYRANYVSADFMFEIAQTQENNLLQESIKYDALTDDLNDEIKRDHMEKYMLACGTYFLSAITYYFMALEGFINVVFHAFLKRDFRDKRLRIDERFDIEQKMKLMPALCFGFLPEHVDSPFSAYDNFHDLKEYRNSIFHAKVEESLKSISFIEDGFFYNCDVSKYQGPFLPTQKNMLTVDSVVKVKTIVADTVQLILRAMTEDTRILTEKYILKSTHIPFFILSDGSLSLGRIDNDQKT